ncbi:MAG TPA: ECF transporter S component [Candidatus Gemmiger avistercoris]|uniref:ECF transporter S component n=1 Tax=Candidatus Gemmiger avistercoris TaxID=2838606 RepID=A0A9D2FKG8_9FIRM|nr:ECF transporter S component [uncultured Subdoligranulum sp.]HIZ62217.1 ECF transporter S component [Candidatus Gemmiger avistercoris]
MDTAVMWLLLFGAVALALLVAALTRTEFTVRRISIIGVMAGLSFVAYEFFRIPFAGGSSFHLGNTFTALTAMLLDGVSGGLAGAIGLALADVLAGDPGYAFTTFILKFIIGLVCGAAAHRLLHTRSGKADGGPGYLLRVTGAAFSGLFVNVFTDPLLGYFRDRYIFGQTVEVASVLVKVTGGVTLVNSLVSTVCAVVLYLALEPALQRAHLLPKEHRI